MTARVDGRASDDLRPVRFEVNYTEQPLASVLCRVGRTWVLCTVCLEDSVPRFLNGKGRGWVTAEYSMLPGATDTRGNRESSKGRPSGRSQEIQRLVGRSLRAVIDYEALGERTLWVDCDVLQADGGTRCASITGASVALSIAGERLLARGDTAINPVRESVAAVSVGVVDGALLLDLPYVEDSRASVDMNVVVTERGQFVEVQGTAEMGTFSPDELAGLTGLAQRGCATLTEFQAAAVAEALGADT